MREITTYLRDTIQEKGITILNTYTPNNTEAPNFIKDILLVVNSLSTTNRLSRQELDREAVEINDIINQMNLTDTYRTLHSNTKEYLLFFAAIVFSPK